MDSFKECKTRSDQTTGGIPNQPCVFPFTAYGVVNTRCTEQNTRDDSWCATETDDEGNVVDGKWGNCGIGCPGFRGFY